MGDDSPRPGQGAQGWPYSPRTAKTRRSRESRRPRSFRSESRKWWPRRWSRWPARSWRTFAVGTQPVDRTAGEWSEHRSWRKAREREGVGVSGAGARGSKPGAPGQVGAGASRTATPRPRRRAGGCRGPSEPRPPGGRSAVYPVPPRLTPRIPLLILPSSWTDTRRYFRCVARTSTGSGFQCRWTLVLLPLVQPLTSPASGRTSDPGW